MANFYEEKNKTNFPFEHNGQTLWFSRSCAVAGFIYYTDDNNETYVLVNKRGDGAPDFKGYWNAPCGYLDWDETAEQAMVRETREETAFETDINRWEFKYVQTDPLSSDKQNITIRYRYQITKEEFKKLCLNIDNLIGGEFNEVAEIKLINVKDIDNYKWAFNHDDIIKEYT